MGIFDIFGTGDQQNAAQAQINGLQSGYNQASQLFNLGNQTLATNYNEALQPFLTNYSTANQGQTQLANALGLNGASGNAAAVSGFQNNPGYEFQLDQGNQNVLRNQAATGQLASGNTNIDLLNYGQGVANQNWNSYLAQLQPFLGAANSAATGINQTYTGLGNAINQNVNNQAGAAYGTAAGIGNANANADLAGLGASSNILGALLGIGKMGVSGGGTIGGNALSGAGGALSGIGSSLMGFLSDERAKDDIEKVGELYDGQSVYRYRYKGDPRHQIGLIAQEVEKRTPAAVLPFGPLKGVNYKHATDMAAAIHSFLEAA